MMRSFSTNRSVNGWKAWPSLLAYAAGFVVGCVRGVTVSPIKRRSEAARRWAKKWRQWVSDDVQGQECPCTADKNVCPTNSLEGLWRELAQKSRKEVWVLLGRPAACSSPGGVGGAHEAQVWLAETWYYPIDLARKEGVAVVFCNDRVQEIEALVGPE